MLGIDPAPAAAAAARARGVHTIEDFFGRELAERLVAEGQRADVVHANNVLAHVADTNGFVAGIATVLKPRWYRGRRSSIYSGTDPKRRVRHDLSSASLLLSRSRQYDQLFRRHGLFLNRVEQLPIHGGSLRLFAEPFERPEPMLAGTAGRRAPRRHHRFAFYRDFSERVRRLRERLRELLGDLRAERSIDRWLRRRRQRHHPLEPCRPWPGRDRVRRRPQHLQAGQMGARRSRCRYFPPSAILERKPDFVLVLPWNFKDEIIAQQADYLRGGGRFIVPVPEPVVVSDAMTDHDLPCLRQCRSSRDLSPRAGAGAQLPHAGYAGGGSGFPCGEIDLAFCQACGFIQNRRYDPSLQAYSPAYEETQFFSPRFRQFLAELCDDQVSRHRLDGKTLLEIGCGKGEFLAAMCERADCTRHRHRSGLSAGAHGQPRRRADSLHPGLLRARLCRSAGRLCLLPAYARAHRRRGRFHAAGPAADRFDVET